MNTDRENNHGEYWADEGIYMRFNMKKLWAWLVSLFLLSGVCQAQVAYCGVDVAKDLVPNGGVAKGTLSNLFAYSDPADGTGWTNVAGVTRTSNSTIAPDGTLTADTLVATATTDGHVMGALVPNRYSATSGLSYRHIGYFKAGTSSEVVFFEAGDAVSHGFHFNLNTKVASTFTNITNWGYEDKANGWVKLFFVYTRVNTSVAPTRIGFVNAGGSNMTGATWLAAGTETLFLWGLGAQLASAPSDLLETNGAALTLGPLCPVGYTQSLTDPSRCFIVGPVTSRTFRTW
jgi:hypothetical protein